MEDMIEKQKLARDLAEQGNNKAAIELLFDLVVECAKAGNFEAAESIRSRIVAIDPMAFSAIIRSGEIIEAEKNHNIDADHRQIWASLYEALSVEEGNALYFGSQKASYEAGETVFAQGDCKPRLFLIDRGQANIIFSQEGVAFFLKSVEAGQFAGEDVFFPRAICTTSMLAQSRLEVRYLDANVLKGWNSVHPGLESKLMGFVAGVESTSELLKSRQMDRRRMDRIALGGKATALLLNLAGDQVGNPFRVDLCDISRGGVCFMLRISRRESAGQLLGIRLCLSYLDPKMSSAQNIEQCGTIVGIQFHPFEDCTVNVKFDEFLPDGLLKLRREPSIPAPNFDF
ncbi:MAG: cyclic nucleotide-binding domain-containing protein [Syntrophobacteraceae bacterium]|nr:cyclic nucleotide-binding domain-containing protein [Syntrophobacteraceae bacterium]